MKMLKLTSFVLVLLLTMLFTTPFTPTKAQDGGNGRVTICHISGNTEDPANYVTITISVNGLNGHFDNGLPRAGHENDFMGPCPGDEVSGDGYVPIVIERTTCNNLLVYHTDITGDWEIFRMGGNERNPANLSQGTGAIDMNPSLAPDRRWVAFASNRDGDWEIFVANTNGRFVQQLTFNDTDDTDPVWSPDGTQIVYQTMETGTPNLGLVETLSGKARLLTKDTMNNLDPYWSPDGTKIVFQRLGDNWVRQIFEITLNTQEIRQLTQGGVASVDPQYSPDGQWIAYRQVGFASNRGSIYIMIPDGSKARAISPLNVNAFHFAWSPQSNMLAYASDWEGDDNIYIYDLLSATTRRLTANVSNDYAPTWYCDSSTVVFTSRVMGDPDLFMLNALPITDPPVDIQFGMGQMTTSLSADTYPHGSPLDEDASRALINQD